VAAGVLEPRSGGSDGREELQSGPSKVTLEVSVNSKVGRLLPRCPPLKMVTTSASTPSWASMLWDAELHALARPVQPLGPDTTIRSGVWSMSSSARSSSIERHDEKVSPAGIEARRTSKSAQTPPRRPCHGTALSWDAGVMSTEHCLSTPSRHRRASSGLGASSVNHRIRFRLRYGVDYAHFLRDRRAGDEAARSKYHLGVAMSM
jgi:hypothetical protein